MTMNTYLNFNGDCAEAFNLYEKVLGGKIVMSMTYGQTPMGQDHPDMADKIGHARLVTENGQILMGSDSPPSMASVAGGFSVSLLYDDVETAKGVFEALTEGGTVFMPFGETFWAFGFGMGKDKFGIPWMVNCERPM